MVVIIKDGKTYFIEWEQGAYCPGCEKSILKNKENSKVWSVNKKKQRIMGTDNSRLSDILRYEKIFPKELNIKTLSLEVYPKIRSIENQFRLGFNEVYFAEGENAYLLCGDGAVVKIEEIIADCSDSSLVINYYEIYKDLPVYDRLKAIFKDYTDINPWRIYPVTVTESNGKRTFIEGGDY